MGCISDSHIKSCEAGGRGGKKEKQRNLYAQYKYTSLSSFKRVQSYRRKLFKVHRSCRRVMRGGSCPMIAMPEGAVGPSSESAMQQQSVSSSHWHTNQHVEECPMSRAVVRRVQIRSGPEGRQSKAESAREREGGGASFSLRGALCPCFDFERLDSAGMA